MLLMSRSKKPTEAPSDQPDQLPAAVNRLADDIHMLREEMPFHLV